MVSRIVGVTAIALAFLLMTGLIPNIVAAEVTQGLAQPGTYAAGDGLNWTMAAAVGCLFMGCGLLLRRVIR